MNAYYVLSAVFAVLALAALAAGLRANSYESAVLRRDASMRKAEQASQVAFNRKLMAEMGVSEAELDPADTEHVAFFYAQHRESQAAAGQVRVVPLGAA